LRKEALRARRELREAKKFSGWQKNGWQLKHWQERQVVRLDIGKLDEQMRAANVAYGHGVGAQTGLTKEHALTLEIFNEGPLREYFR